MSCSHYPLGGSGLLLKTRWQPPLSRAGTFQQATPRTAGSGRRLGRDRAVPVAVPRCVAYRLRLAADWASAVQEISRDDVGLAGAVPLLAAAPHVGWFVRACCCGAV